MQALKALAAQANSHVRSRLNIQQQPSHVQALKALAAKANGDVRSCLNTLQLLATQHGRIHAAHVAATALGVKDMTAAPFEVWEALLLGRGAVPDDFYSYLMAFGEHSMVRGSQKMLDLFGCVPGGTSGRPPAAAAVAGASQQQPWIPELTVS